MKHLVTALTTFIHLFFLHGGYGGGVVWAQDVARQNISGIFVLSTTASFSSDERVFDREQTLFIRLNAFPIDYTGLELNEFRLEPVGVENGSELGKSGTFENRFDGTYTAQFDLIELPEFAIWRLTAIVGDDRGRVFSIDVRIVVGSALFEDLEAEIDGIVEVVNEQSIVLHDRTFEVPANTVITTEGGKPLELGDIRVGDEVNAVVTFRNSGDEAYITSLIVRINQDRIEDLILTGDIAELLEEKVVVQGFEFELTNATKIIGLDGTEATVDDLARGMPIRVIGQFAPDEGLIAIVLVAIDVARDGFTLEGFIESVSDEAVVIAGTFSEVTENTVVINENGIVIPVSTLQEGDFVSVRAQLGNQGLPVAICVKQEEGVVETIVAQGTIDQVSAENLVVQGRRYSLNSQTLVVDTNGQLISPGLLRVGLDVAIMGQYNEDGQLVALQISPGSGGLDEFSPEGVITSIESEGIMVKDALFRVTEGTIVVDQDGVRLTPTDLYQGMFVEVFGSRAEDGFLSANKIEIERFFADVSSVIDQINDNELSIAGIPFLFDDSTLITGPTGLQFARDNLLVGTRVHTEGILVASTDFGGSDEASAERRVYRAASIEVTDDITESYSINGTIRTLTDSFFEIGTIVFLINEETTYKDEQGADISFAELEAGMVVKTQAVELENGEYAAILVQKEANGPSKVVGDIEFMFGSTVLVSDLAFDLSSETELIGSEGQQITTDELSVGRLVRVILNVSPSGSLIAQELRILSRIEDEVTITGLIDAVRDDFINVLSRPISVLNNTQVVDENNNIISLEELVPGSTVSVRADLIAGDELIALRVRLLPDQPDTVRVEGPLQILDENTISLMGIEFIADSDTGILDVTGDSLLFNQLEDGTFVDLLAVRQLNGSHRAISIRSRDVFILSGILDDFSSENITVLGETYPVNPSTLILEYRNNHTLPDLFRIGEYVEIRGVSTDTPGVNASYVVTRVKSIGEAQGQPTSFEEDVEWLQPDQFALYQNYPNPFNLSTTIPFGLNGYKPVDLSIYNVLGERVRIFQQNTLTPGDYAIEWDGKDELGRIVPSGIYFYRLSVGEQMKTNKMILVK